MSAAGETVTGQEIRFSRVDGRLVPTYSVSTPITGYGPHAFLVAVTDLTERERATQLLRSVLSSVGDAILTINEHGVIGSAIPAAITQFGYTEDELIGLSVTALMQEQFVHEHEGGLVTGAFDVGDAVGLTQGDRLAHRFACVPTDWLRRARVLIKPSTPPLRTSLLKELR